jgi:hypothetical protein
MNGLLNIFGDAQGLEGLIDPKQIAAAQNNALLNAGLSIMAASAGGQPGTGRAPLAPALLQGLQAGQGAFKSSIEGQVGNVLTGQKIAEAKRQKDILAQRQKLLSNTDPSRLNEAYAASLQSGDLELAKVFADQIKASRQVLKPGERLYEGEKVIAEGAADPEKRRLTGAVGNLALTMFGTSDVGSMSPQQLQAVDAEARRRNLERPPSTIINMPSESERTAGFLVQRLQGGLQSLATASGIDPSAIKPNAPGELVQRLTGSETLKNMAIPAQRQVIEAAQLEVLDSALTLGTGAAYTREQLEGYRRSYFPQIGDSAQTITDKQKRLNNLLGAARIKSGKATPTDIGLPAGVTVERVK